MNLVEGVAVVPPAAADASGARVTIGPHTGCRNLVQRLIDVRSPGFEQQATPGSEDVGYVVSGTGRLVSGTDALRLEPGTGYLVPAGTQYRLAPDDGPMSVVSVVCPPPGEATRDAPDGPAPCVTVREADQPPLPAGESRFFKLLVDPAVGCRGVTQFLGFIEESRAPEHVHTYEEVIHILGGAGTLHAAGLRIPFERGSSIFLAPGTPHCLENGTGETLRLLGVFSPAGSPADKRED